MVTFVESLIILTDNGSSAEMLGMMGLQPSTGSTIQPPITPMHPSTLPIMSVHNAHVFSHVLGPAVR
ncbi:hypothetical protein N7471_007444 [Penicillium samsonianum]|uniref:uncharacterized protein n=1 Tax=Penicillium samsonianum TaxID=1882272 RepID=UPI002547BBF7|nr:uncharacterized protein N7471_007444 [Penicillium samsonianum]KAJ6132229.1 hypothetical protein N7471_007444 [Penicillium samsonianum]